jgi:hypothetical protein
MIAAVTKNTSTTHFAFSSAIVQGGENENDFLGNAGNHNMLLN